MAKDIKHLNCFSAIRDSSNENSLFRAVPHFLTGLFGLLMSFLKFFMYFGAKPSVRYWFGEDLFSILQAVICLIDCVL